MTRLQDDVLSIYNSLTEFSKETLLNPVHLPIKVSYSESLNSLCFEQRGYKVAVNPLNYYCENLKDLKETYLLPEDYDLMMSSLARLIGSGVLLHDRVCLSPIKYGFRIYDVRPGMLKEGPQLIDEVVVVSSNSWLFRAVTKQKFKKLL